VFACDTDKERISMALHNARVYNVREAVSFVHDDALNVMKKTIFKGECSPFSSRKVDMIFLSPPWGGPEYRTAETFDLGSILVSGVTLIHVLNIALKLCRNVALFLPRNTDLQSLAAQLTVPFKAEREYVNGKQKSLTLYFGKLA
jgi:trimethylguanosine synthase